MYFANPILDWKHSGPSLPDEKYVSVVGKGYRRKKLEIIWAGDPGRIEFPSFPMTGKVKLINVNTFPSCHIRPFSSNRETPNIHLVGKVEIIFPAIGIRIKD